MTGPSAPDPRRNLLLRALPAEEYEQLVPLLEPLELEVRDQIAAQGSHIEHVHFPVGAVLSLVATMDGESAVEVATIGYEGMSGLPAFLGSPEASHNTFCQVRGWSLRLATADLRRYLSTDGALHRLLHRYTQATMVQLAQTVVCNRLHTTEERCARWLLQTRDRVAADEFELKQEFLGQMLGVRRGTVSAAAGVLQEAGMIRYTRGRITVLDAGALHETACDCYDVIRRQYQQLISRPER